MTADPHRARRQRLLRTLLPWAVAGGGLLLYLGTLNPWISLGSLRTVASTSGWLWQPQLQQPFSFLVLCPLRLLPEPWIPLSVNLVTALCAALVLWLLARSVVLLPHDRMREQRWRETSRDSTLSMSTAWMPPVLAALACGLQLTFWENATSGTGVMFNLLVLASALWCLLEFRIDRNESWLFGSAVLWGAGMTNDWLMVGCWPMFVVAVMGLKRLSFFNARFLVRMGLSGLAGLSLYLVLPAVELCSGASEAGFWPALKATLKLQRDALMTLPKGALVVMTLTCWLPLLFISLRWKSQDTHSGDDNPITTFLTKALSCLMPAGLLTLSLWLALDPPFSHRNLAAGVPLLAPYYLSALVIGYCSGYLLLVGSVPIPGFDRFRRRPRLQQLTARVTVAGFGLLLASVPLALVWRNLGQIRITNGPAVRSFAREVCQSLPSGKSVVLSDDPIQLFLVQAELGVRGSDRDSLLLDVNSLVWRRYHIVKAGQFKSRWPRVSRANGGRAVAPAEVTHLLTRFSSSEQLVYLHPSFSYCLEPFAARQQGGVVCLVPQPGGALGLPLDSQRSAANERYWNSLWHRSLQGLSARTAGKQVDGMRETRGLRARLQLIPERNRTAAYLAAVYSKALNHWGVQMQRQGRWHEAGRWFERALELQPENLAARINLHFNGRHQRGVTQRLDMETVHQEFLLFFGKRRCWEDVINEDGPVDEPTFLNETARVLLAGGRPRQAIREYRRCVHLAPDWFEPKLWLAQAHVTAREFASALRITHELEVNGLPQEESSLAQFLFCRVTALRGLGQTNEATAGIESFVARHFNKPEVLSIAAKLSLEGGQHQQALSILDRLLAREPANTELLSNKGLAEMELARYAAAIATLNRALALAPSNQVVRLNRAIANLRAGNLEVAWDDYQRLLQTAPESYQVLFGLAEIAWRRKDTNAAIQLYERCLAHRMPASVDHRLVVDRLRQLGGKGH